HQINDALSHPLDSRDQVGRLTTPSTQGRSNRRVKAHRDPEARGVDGSLSQVRSPLRNVGYPPRADLQPWVPSVRFLPVACANQAGCGQRCADTVWGEYGTLLRRDFASFALRCFRELNPRTQFAMNWH